MKVGLTELGYYAAALFVILASIYILFSVPSTEEVVNTQPQSNNPVVERALSIMDSEQFQAEMRALATSRALFEMSQEKQQEAIELSEMAIQSYRNSQSLADQWHASTTVGVSASVR